MFGCGLERKFLRVDDGEIHGDYPSDMSIKLHLCSVLEASGSILVDIERYGIPQRIGWYSNRCLVYYVGMGRLLQRRISAFER